MSRYRKKPVVIDAFRWAGSRGAAVEPLWLYQAIENRDVRFSDDLLHIRTLEGEMTAQPGDWIIRGIKGEIYPCKPDIFAATYEAVL